jgi:uncharacterized protein
MDAHLRFSGLPYDAQAAELERIIRAEPVLMAVLEGLRDAALPDGLLVAGAIYNTVWNVLTDRPALNGVNDIDVFYFDDSDLSYAAEDLVIKAMAARFADLPLPVQVRNQARVHLWYPQKFGQEFSPLTSSGEMLGRYASKTHAVAARLDEGDKISILAPFGLDDIFSFRIVPNPVLTSNRATHDRKGARAKSVWPEIEVVPW